FVNQVPSHAVSRDIEPHGALAFSIESVLRRFAALQVPDVSGPYPGRLIGESSHKPPFGLESQRMILMTGAIRNVRNARIVGERPRLVDKRPQIGDRLVDVVAPLALARVGSNIGCPKSRLPMLVLDGDVILHAVRI